MSGPLLTGTELTVLRRAANGETYAVIASALGYQEKSVSKMALRLARKLGANNITHAVHLAHLAGLLRRERHGDHAGFAAHRYRDEEPCDDCWAGERTYRAEQRQRRRQEAASGPQSAPEAANGAWDVRGAAGATQGRSEPRGEAAA